MLESFEPIWGSPGDQLGSSGGHLDRLGGNQVVLASGGGCCFVYVCLCFGCFFSPQQSRPAVKKAMVEPTSTPEKGLLQPVVLKSQPKHLHQKSNSLNDTPVRRLPGAAATFTM